MIEKYGAERCDFGFGCLQVYKSETERTSIHAIPIGEITWEQILQEGFEFESEKEYDWRRSLKQDCFYHYLEKNLNEFNPVPIPTDMGIGYPGYYEDKYHQFLKEALGHEYKEPQRWETNEICDTVNQMIADGTLTGWRNFDQPKRFFKYGTQKGWERVGGNVNGDVSTDDGFVPVPEQMQLPFD